MKKIHKRLLAGLLAAVMLAGQTAVFAVAAPEAAPEASKDINLALEPDVVATADNSENSHPASAAVDGDRTNNNSRWATDNDGRGTTPRTLTLDLGKTCTINSVKVFWEAENIQNYFVETSADEKNWDTQVTVEREAGQREDAHTLPKPVDARYIRLRVTKYSPAIGQWFNVSAYEFEVYGQKKVTLGNLATLDGVKAEADNTDGNTFTADKTIDGDLTNDSRWGSQNDSAGTTPRTLTLDLGAERTITSFKVFWEKTNIRDYHIDTSTDKNNWEKRVDITNADAADAVSHDLQTPVNARYVRLVATKYVESVTGWYNVGVREFEVHGHMPETVEPPKDELVTAPEGTNLALLNTVRASATNVESNTNFTADKARDGNKTAKESRWATNKDVPNPTITYDLGAKYMVGSVILYWENNNPEKWHVQTSLDGQNWTTQKTFDSKLSQVTAPIQTVNFDAPVEARHVRVWVEKYHGGWNNVALYEFEVYQGKSEIVRTPATVADELARSIKLENGKVVMTGEVPEKYTATWGCNYEQVVGADGTVYTPLVNTKVEITVTVREAENTMASGSSKVELTIPGVHSANEGNAKPAVVPELAQWYSSAEQNGKVFTLNAQSRIVADEAMLSVAKELKNDIQDLFDLDLPIVTEAAKAGDIQLMYLDGAGFDKETYNMEVTDRVVIQANHTTGAYWGTRSVLQALVLSKNQTIAQGTARDYPEFENRGFMLDVGRKPMSMEMLRNFVKNMSWYKMNNFHIHLSDNLIFMEKYVEAGKELEAWNSYQGFRLESNKEGLTSKDYFYTKQEFKSFMEDSRALGVDITPEIDVPAHALSIANYIKNTLGRDDLVLHKKGGNNRPWFDHVDISNPEAIEIVKTIFDEYIDEDLFDENTVVHIGADEFYDSHPAYRNFLIQMIDYIQNTKHRQVRVWGSLSSMSGQPNKHPFKPEHVQGAQMNIWDAGWAKPQDMFNLGFNLINTIGYDLYIVPNGSGNRGGYVDFLKSQNLYNGWEPENFGGTWIPTGSDQMMGATFAIWQDNIDTHASGINETDTFYRFMDAMPYLSVKMWGTGGDGLDRNFNDAKADIETLGTAPNSDPYHEIELAPDTQEYAHYSFKNSHDISGNKHNLTLNGATIQDGSLVLNGGKSYAETGLNVMGPNNSITMRVYKDSAHQDGEQILLEADAAYGETTIKALPSKDGSWKLGFARELYEYVFNYDLPHDQWVELTIRNEGNKTYLLVGDKKIEAVGSFLPDEHATTKFMGKTGIKHSSFDMPVARIGSTTNAFQGKVDSVSFHANNVTPTERFEVQFVSMDGSILDTAAVVAGQPVAKPQDPVLDGFVFGGWFTDKNCTTAYDFAAPVESDMMLYAKWTAIDKSMLKEQIDKAEAMIHKQDQYVQTNWQQMLDALAEAKKVMANKHATEADVKAATESLANAISAQLIKADKSALKDLVTKAEKKKLNGYTAESVKAFQTALDAAKKVLADENLSKNDQAVVDKAVESLDAAIRGLTAEKAPSQPQNNNTNNSQNSNANNAQNNNANNPHTGDETNLVIWSIALVLSAAGAGAVLFFKRRRS